MREIRDGRRAKYGHRNDKSQPGVRGKVGDTYFERNFNEDESFVERFLFFFFYIKLFENEKKKIDYTCIRDSWKFRIMDRESFYIRRFNYTFKPVIDIIIFVAITRSDI